MCSICTLRFSLISNNGAVCHSVDLCIYTLPCVISSAAERLSPEVPPGSQLPHTHPYHGPTSLATSRVPDGYVDVTWHHRYTTDQRSSGSHRCTTSCVIFFCIHTTPAHLYHLNMHSVRTSRWGVISWRFFGVAFMLWLVNIALEFFLPFELIH